MITEAQREKYNQRRREKYATDLEFRTKVKTRSKLHYHANRQGILVTSSARYSTDVQFAERKRLSAHLRYVSDPSAREANKARSKRVRLARTEDEKVAHRKVARDSAKKQYKKNKDRMLVGPILCRARNRAKKDGIQFTITKADLYVPAKCPILDIELFFG